MPINVANAESNYKASATLAASKYKQKVSVNTDWQAHASSPQSEQNWATKVADAAANQRRAKAIAKVPQTTWVQKASTQGATNLPQGMTNNADKWAQNFGPFAAVIDNAVATMPPRGVGIATNIQRVLAIGTALENAKKSMG